MTPATTPPARARYKSKAPARPRPVALLVSTATSVAALVLVAAVGSWLHQKALIPPLAASMALVAGTSSVPLAQPRNVIGGQLVSAGTGYIVLAIAGPGVWSAAVAGGLALGVMLLLRVGHSPAAAGVLVVVQAGPSGPSRVRVAAPGAW